MNKILRTSMYLNVVWTHKQSATVECEQVSVLDSLLFDHRWRIWRRQVETTRNTAPKIYLQTLAADGYYVRTRCRIWFSRRRQRTTKHDQELGAKLKDNDQRNGASPARSVGCCLCYVTSSSHCSLATVTTQVLPRVNRTWWRRKTATNGYHRNWWNHKFWQ